MSVYLVGVNVQERRIARVEAESPQDARVKARRGHWLDSRSDTTGGVPGYVVTVIGPVEQEGTP